MKRAALIFFLLCSSVSLANTREWKDAKVLKISSESGVAAAAPIGGMMVTVPIVKTWYYIATEDTVYVLGPAITKRQMLNVTLYGKTKTAPPKACAH
jgi:hypothetical protein